MSLSLDKRRSGVVSAAVDRCPPPSGSSSAARCLGARHALVFVHMFEDVVLSEVKSNALIETRTRPHCCSAVPGATARPVAGAVVQVAYGCRPPTGPPESGAATTVLGERGLSGHQPCRRAALMTSVEIGHPLLHPDAVWACGSANLEETVGAFDGPDRCAGQAGDDLIVGGDFGAVECGTDLLPVSLRNQAERCPVCSVGHSGAQSPCQDHRRPIVREVVDASDDACVVGEFALLPW